jgi:hypothetical protein
MSENYNGSAASVKIWGFPPHRASLNFIGTCSARGGVAKARWLSLWHSYDGVELGDRASLESAGVTGSFAYCPVLVRVSFA